MNPRVASFDAPRSRDPAIPRSRDPAIRVASRVVAPRVVVPPSTRAMKSRVAVAVAVASRAG
jgi:hypothetical protein